MKILNLFIILILLTLNLNAQIIPPSQYPYNNIVKKVEKNFEELDFSSTNEHNYTISNTPLKLTLDDDPGALPCISNYSYSGIAQLSLSAEQFGAYEFGKEDLSGSPIFSFKTYLEVDVNRTTSTTDIKVLTTILEITSVDNKVKNIKIITENFDVNVGGILEIIKTLYVSRVKLLPASTTPQGIDLSKFILRVECDIQKVITANNVSTNSPLLKVDMKNNGTDLLVEANVFDLSKMNSTNQNKDNTSTLEFDDIFKWSIFDACIYSPFMYEVQILRLYNTKKEYQYNNKSIYCNVDWTKSLSVYINGMNDTKQLKNYIVTEGTGYYIWRVRPIGNVFEGGINNFKNYGEWNLFNNGGATNYSTYSNGNIINIEHNGTSYISGNNSRVYYFQLNEDLNWTHSRVFTEGKNGETQFHDVIQYYDDLLNLRQTQKTVPSMMLNILQQNILDHQARPTLQSLPVCVSQDGLPLQSGFGSYKFYADINLSYKKKVFPILTSGIEQFQYDFRNFDIGYGVPDALPNISSNYSILNDYYNGDNNFRGVPLSLFSGFILPSANNYPFTRTVLSNDGSNKVIEQSLPGYEHRIQNLNDPAIRTATDIHTIRNYYTKASEEELVALFGKESPNPSTINKEINVDPNNISTYTYKDNKGRVIATGVRSIQPTTSNLQNINEYDLNNNEINAKFNKSINYTFDSPIRNDMDFNLYGNIYVPSNTNIYFNNIVSLPEFKLTNNCILPNTLLDNSYNLAYYTTYGLNDHLSRIPVFSPPSFSAGFSINTPISYAPSITSLVNTGGDYDAFLKLKLENPSNIKNYYINEVNDIINNLYSTYKITDLLSSIDIANENILKNPSVTSTNNEFKKIIDKLDGIGINGYKNSNINIWTKTPNPDKYSLKIGNCIDLDFTPTKCDECNELAGVKKTSTDTGIEFSEFLITKFIDYNYGKTIYFLDKANLHNDIERSFKVKYSDGIKYSESDLAMLDDLFYQYGYKLNFNRFVDNNQFDYMNLNSIFSKRMPHIYEALNQLYYNLHSDADYNLNDETKLRVCRAINYFVDKFPKIPREFSIEDVNRINKTNYNEKNQPVFNKSDNFQNCLLIDVEINTLDILLDKTYKKLERKSTFGTTYGYNLEFISDAYRYFKDPKLVLVEFENWTGNYYNINLFPHDELIPFAPIQSIEKPCLANDIYHKYHEMDYKTLSSQILLNPTQTQKYKGEIIAEFGNKDGRDKGKELVKAGILTPEELALYLDALRDKYHRQNICDLIEKMNANAKRLCDNSKKLFENALIDYLHNIDNPVEIQGYEEITGSTYVFPESNFNNLVDLLVSDCEKFMTINTKFNSNTNLCEKELLSTEYETAREKFVSSFLRGDKLEIKYIKIQLPTHPIEFKSNTITYPSFLTSEYEKNCFYIARFEKHKRSQEMLEDIVKNDIIPKLESILSLQRSTSNQNINSIDFRLQNYKDLILGLDSYLASKYPYLENKLSSNSSYNPNYPATNNNIDVPEFTCFLDNELFFQNKNWFNEAFPSSSSGYFFELFKDPAYQSSQKYHCGTTLVSNSKSLNSIRESERWSVLNYPENFYHSFKSFSKNTYDHYCDKNNFNDYYTAKLNLHLTNKSRFYWFGSSSFGRYDYNINFVNNNLTQRSLNANVNINVPPNYNSIFSSADNSLIHSGTWQNMVIPIRLNITKNRQTMSDLKENESQSISEEYSSEIIWISEKAGSMYDCNVFEDFSYPSATNTNDNCNIIYKFEPAPAELTSEELQNAECKIIQLETLKEQIIRKITQYKQDLVNSINVQVDQYVKDIPKNLKQQLNISYNDQIQHFTLYYYDRAGNLVRTVPPKGVSLKDAQGVDNTRLTSPNHKFVTYYSYNNRGQVTQSDSPDENEYNKFIYSKLGHLKFSQSARQRTINRVSYIRYDKYMRIIENGELKTNPSSSSDILLNPDIINGIESRDFPNTIPSGLSRSFVIITNYENNPAIPGYYGLPPTRTYLNNKVNYRTRDEDGNLFTKSDQVISYYSYDIHGNVNFIIQNLPTSFSGNLRLFAQTDYEYDLISKKVKGVHYNYYQSDSHLQEYSYDEDNRLKKVRTSRYGYLWDQDADYQYLPHGPLRRIALGQDFLQGIDFTYTIHGWLKGINHVEITNTISTSKDPGRDGCLITSNIPISSKDAFSEILNYYDGDFQNSTFNYFNSSNRLNQGKSNFFGLYNGNIASIENNYEINALNLSLPNQLDFTYRYDYLNRLKKSETMERSLGTSPTWASTTNYNTDYSYDANGNIKTLARNNNGNLIDNLMYNYGLPNPNSNKLINLNESAPDQPSSTTDIRNGVHPYSYDASGNLISDVSEGISQIDWTVDGKVKTISYSNGKPAITYLYDASGNRIQKRVGTSPSKAVIDYTIYARDANEQVMAIYERQTNDNTDNTDPTITTCVKLKLEFSNPTHGCVIDINVCDNYIYIPSTGALIITTPLSSQVNCGGTILTLNIQANTVFNLGRLTPDDIRKQWWPIMNVSGLAGLYDGNSLLATVTGGSVTYQNIISDITKMPKLSEWHIYGNEQQGRFTVRKPDAEPLYYLDVLTTDVTNQNFFRILDKKQYELKDHLGNVRVAIGDMKIPTGTRGVAPFVVDEKAVNDYYPYGMLISDRSWSSGSSRYGYNGKEMDNEVKGVGNQLDFSARIYDNRTIRFYSLDPDMKIYTSYSPYIFAINNPILYVDENGKGPKDRVKYATSFLTIPYKQQYEKMTNKITKEDEYGFRTEWNERGLQFLDCSELVCRVFYLDGIDKKTISKATHDLYNDFTKKDSKFNKSDKPILGSTVLWYEVKTVTVTDKKGKPELDKDGEIKTKEVFEGHIGIITKVYPNNTFDFIDAPNSKSVCRINVKKNTDYSSHQFIGFFSPKKDSPDIIPDNINFKNPDEALKFKIDHSPVIKK